MLSKLLYTYSKSAATSTLSYKLVDDEAAWGNEMQGDGDGIEEAVVEKDRTFKKKAANGGSSVLKGRVGSGHGMFPLTSDLAWSTFSATCLTSDPDLL